MLQRTFEYTLNNFHGLRLASANQKPFTKSSLHKLYNTGSDQSCHTVVLKNTVDCCIDVTSNSEKTFDLGLEKNKI